MRKLDLQECQTPEQVVNVLRAAAEQFHQDAEELTTAWQERNGVWDDIAREMDRTADRLARIFAKRYPEWTIDEQVG